MQAVTEIKHIHDFSLIHLQQHPINLTPNFWLQLLHLLHLVLYQQLQSHKLKDHNVLQVILA